MTLRNVAAGNGNTSSGGGKGEKGYNSTLAVTAKLQTVRLLPFLPSPLYILRFKRATRADEDTAAAIARIEGAVQDDSGDESPRGMEEEEEEEEGDVDSTGHLNGSAGSDEAGNAASDAAEGESGDGSADRPQLTVQRKMRKPSAAAQLPVRQQQVQIARRTTPPHFSSGGGDGADEAGGAGAVPKRVAFLPHHDSIRSLNKAAVAASSSAGKPSWQQASSQPSSGSAARGRNNHHQGGSNGGSGSGRGLIVAMAPIDLRQPYEEGAASNTTTTTTLRHRNSGSCSNTSGRDISGRPSFRGSPAAPVSIDIDAPLSTAAASAANAAKVTYAKPKQQPKSVLRAGSVGPGLVHGDRGGGGDNGSAIGGRAGSVLGGRAGSVHSKGSGTKGSGTSATSFTEVLRRGIASRSAHVEGSLLHLRQAIIVVFVMVALMNVASLAVSSLL